MDESPPLLVQDGAADGLSFTGTEGVLVRGLHLACAGCVDGVGTGVRITGELDDVALEDLTLTGFDVGVRLEDREGLHDRVFLRDSVVSDSWSMGFWGASTDGGIDNTTFERNGRSDDDHGIWWTAGANRTSGGVIRGNYVTRSALSPVDSCEGTQLLVSGQHDDVVVDGNLVEDVLDAAGQTCWGIAVMAFEPDVPESFERITVRNNVVVDVGIVGIGLTSCSDCLVENNIVSDAQSYHRWGINAPSTRSDPATPRWAA